MSTNPVK